MRVLIIESDADRHHAIVELGQATGLPLLFETASSVSAGVERVLAGGVAVCIIGPSVVAEQKQLMALSLRDRPEGKKCQVIVALSNAEARLANSIAASGAAGVLTEPYDKEMFRRLLQRASAETEGQPVNEQITSLPWILHNLSGRLRTLADRLKTEQQAGQVLTASPKLIKEALLGVIGSNNSDELVEEILKSARAAEGKE